MLKRRKKENATTNTSAIAVMGDLFNPHVDQRRAYIRYVCKKLLEHPTFTSDLVRGLACFDTSELLTFPKSEATDCYSLLFQSFFVRGWLAKELKNIHMDENREFFDDLRYVYLYDLHNGLKIEDIVTFLSVKLALATREYTAYEFKFCFFWGIGCQSRPQCLWVHPIKMM